MLEMLYLASQCVGSRPIARGLLPILGVGILDLMNSPGSGIEVGVHAIVPRHVRTNRSLFGLHSH